jgi:chromosomal replication initiation ATPase DnaA
MSTQWFCPHCDGEIAAKDLRIVTPQMTMRQVVIEIAALHEVKPSDITGKVRTRKFVDARHHAIKEINRRHSNYSSIQLGKFFNMDHSSILSALGTLKSKSSVQNRNAEYRPPQRRLTYVPQACPVIEA